MEIVKHVFQRVLCEPAIKKDGDEEMPKGRKENLPHGERERETHTIGVIKISLSYVMNDDLP
jgi:hypothetical protein